MKKRFVIRYLPAEGEHSPSWGIWDHELHCLYEGGYATRAHAIYCANFHNYMLHTYGQPG